MGGATQDASPKQKRQKQSREEAAAPAAWNVTLELPTERLDHIFRGFTPQEKADAITAVLQARLS